MNRKLTLSGNGAEFIGAFEGFVGHVYDDAAGNATIGFGHLLHAGRATKHDYAAWRAGVTRRQAEELLRRDAQRMVAAVHDTIHVHLTQQQFDALVSFAYNCGPGALAGSVGRAVNSRPRLVNWTNLHDWYRRVTDALLLWDHAGGRVLAGLERRRMAEARLFEIGRYSQRGGNSYSNWKG